MKPFITSLLLLVVATLQLGAVTIDVKERRFRTQVPDTTAMSLTPDREISLVYSPDSLTRVYILALDANARKSKFASDTDEFSWKQDYLETVDRTVFKTGELVDSVRNTWIHEIDKTYAMPDSTWLHTRTRFGERFAYCIAIYSTERDTPAVMQALGDFDTPVYSTRWPLLTILTAMFACFVFSFAFEDYKPLENICIALGFIGMAGFLGIALWEGINCVIRGYAPWYMILDGLKYFA